MSVAAVTCGDALAVLAEREADNYDAVLCDPPYGLSFMGKAWDHGVPGVEVWREVWRVLKPGAPLIAFGGTRTFHRLAVAIEDAGFEIRDCLSWLYGSGFPKSLDVSKAIDAANGDERPVSGTKAVTRVMRGSGDLVGGNVRAGTILTTSAASAASAAWEGYGTALKPAWEPAILARKPLDGTVAENVTRWGVGGLAIDAGRIGRAPDDASGWSTTGSKASENRAMSGANYAREPVPDNAAGRWPANVLLDEEAAAALDEQSGESKSSDHIRKNSGTDSVAREGKHRAHDGYSPAESGGASRFFYVAKASRRERGQGNAHPTVKPIALARYLATLLLPPAREGAPRRLLVPFSGSGSEMIGALRAGWDHVDGIEREPEYAEIARARLRAEQDAPPPVERERKPKREPAPRRPKPPAPPERVQTKIRRASLMAQLALFGGGV